MITNKFGEMNEVEPTPNEIMTSQAIDDIRQMLDISANDFDAMQRILTISKAWEEAMFINTEYDQDQ